MNLAFIKKAAPWIATVAGVAGIAVPAAAPFLGIASKLLTNGLGVKVDATASGITAAMQKAMESPEDLAKLKDIDNQFAMQMKQLDIQSTEDFEKMATADRADARAMQEQTRSKIPAVLTIAVTLGFFVLLAMVAFHAIPEANAKVLDIMLGTLSMAWVSCVNFWVGTTNGSGRKTELLALAPPIDQAAVKTA
jgi:hypothetical protein